MFKLRIIYINIPVSQSCIFLYFGKEIKRINTKQIKFVLNKNTEPDLIAHLESIDNVQGYIKTLIRKDMRNRKE